MKKSWGINFKINCIKKRKSLSKINSADEHCDDNDNHTDNVRVIRKCAILYNNKRKEDMPEL